MIFEFYEIRQVSHCQPFPNRRVDRLGGEFATLREACEIAWFRVRRLKSGGALLVIKVRREKRERRETWEYEVVREFSWWKLEGEAA